MVEALADESQHDQRSGGRVDQHENGDGIFDDGAEADVRHREGENREQDGPSLVADLAVRHLGKCLPAGRDKTDGGLEAGKGDGDGKDDLTDAAKIMARDLREGDAAVFRDLKQAARLRAHEDGEDVDDGHEDTGQDAGAKHVARDRVVIVHAHAADDVDDHNPESEARDGVHGAVALDEGGEEGAGFGRVGLRGGDRGDGRAGMDQGRDDEDRKEDQKDGVDDFADPNRDLAGPEREEQHEREENRREDQQCDGLCAVRHQGRKTGRERDGRAARDREERADRQIEQTGEENAVTLTDLARKLLQTVRVRDTDGGHAEDGDTDGGDNEADDRRDDIAAGHLSEMYGEDEVAGAEEHAEQCPGHKNLLLRGQFFHSHGKQLLLGNVTDRRRIV